MLPSGRGEGGCELARAAGTAPQAVGLNRDYLVEGENRCINVVSALPAREPRGGDNNRHAGAAIGKESSAAALVPWGEWVCCPERRQRSDGTVPRRLCRPPSEARRTVPGDSRGRAGDRVHGGRGKAARTKAASLQPRGGRRRERCPVPSWVSKGPGAESKSQAGPQGKGAPPTVASYGPCPPGAPNGPAWTTLREKEAGVSWLGRQKRGPSGPRP